jgi:acetyl esterase/lipase
VYVQRGNRPLKLDLYLPPDSTIPHPLAIWIHGGGWIKGSKGEWVNPLFLTSRGFVLASIQYRLSFEAPFPSQLEDCQSAVRFLRANAAGYDLDPARFAAIGESAGGNLAALLGTTGDSKQPSAAPADSASDRVQAVIDLFGPSDLTAVPDGEPKPETMAFFVKRLLGGTPAQRPDLARAASPIYHISSETPPFLILHGQADPLVPLAQSQMLYAALQKAGIPSELIIVPVSYHAGPGFWTEAMQGKMVSFLEKALRMPQTQ